MKILQSKLILIIIVSICFTAGAQTISFSELKKSPVKTTSGTFAELLTTKGFTFINKTTDEYGSSYSDFASNYNSGSDSWSSFVRIFSCNTVEFIFTDNTKANFNSLITQIKTACAKECFYYSDRFKSYYTCYSLNSEIKIIVYNKKGENGYSNTNIILIVALFSDTEKMNYGVADRYNNAYWFYICKDTNHNK